MKYHSFYFLEKWSCANALSIPHSSVMEMNGTTPLHWRWGCSLAQSIAERHVGFSWHTSTVFKLLHSIGALPKTGFLSGICVLLFHKKLWFHKISQEICSYRRESFMSENIFSFWLFDYPWNCKYILVLRTQSLLNINFWKGIKQSFFTFHLFSLINDSSCSNFLIPDI